MLNAFARSTSAIAWVLFVIVTIGWIVYYFANRRTAKPELGSEIELAANRKPYYDDETLEGKRLERVQGLGLLFLQSVAAADIPVLSAFLVFIALVFVTINFLTDLLYAAIDPRIRLSDKGSIA